MKKLFFKIFISTSFLVLGSTYTHAQLKPKTHTVEKYDTIKFTVYGGKCNQCKINIESAAKYNGGVTLASWDSTTSILLIIYSKSHIQLSEIKKHISHMGYDTDEFKASKRAYRKYATCCKYRDI
jgi:hypothetical protein